MDCVVAPSVLADWLLWSEETLVTKERNRAAKTASAGTHFRQLIDLLVDHGLTIEDVAKRSGVHPTSIHRQAGREGPTSTMRKVCAAFGYDLRKMIHGELVQVSAPTISQPSMHDDLADLACRAAASEARRSTQVRAVHLPRLIGIPLASSLRTRSTSRVEIR